MSLNALSTSPAVRCVGGQDRYETAQQIAVYAFNNSLAVRGFIGVATGLDFPELCRWGRDRRV
ncbi:MAG: cell wall-binding repeat-containing protein [Coriobacteriia bacterium]|nr:cell wall-binding repeat-containing protein [Coriobacteriia bacterium]